tara:strand:- start:142 stop:753 length:612 start_codon:yes stop_codon:yes gene_type:complete
VIEKFTFGQTFFRSKISNQLVDKINARMNDLIKQEEVTSAQSYLSGKIKKSWFAKWYTELDTESEIGGSFHHALTNFHKDAAFHQYRCNMDQAWILDQMEGEYQVTHKHTGQSPVGMASVLFLQVPDFGVEFTETSEPHNGKTTLIFNCNGQFMETQYLITPEVGDLWIFPYDVKHVVYPFRGQGIRRAMSINYDVWPEKIKE